MSRHDPLSLIVLGCDGSYPGPGGACSGYLVRGGDVKVWLDAGSGTLANLQKHLDVTDVDAVVLSHAHPDHWTDIEGFYVACRYFYGRKGVPVWAPAEIPPLARGVHDDGTFVWHSIAGGQHVSIGGLEWHFHRTDHPVETLAMRVDDGRRAFGYSADTGPAWSLSDLGAIDLALVEASLLSSHEGTVQHLSARQAGIAARDAGADRLVITHIGPTIDHADSQAEASLAYGAPVELAAPGARYLI